MHVELIHSNWSTVECDALFVPFFEEDLKGSRLFTEIDESFQGLLSEVT